MVTVFLVKSSGVVSEKCMWFIIALKIVSLSYRVAHRRRLIVKKETVSVLYKPYVNCIFKVMPDNYYNQHAEAFFSDTSQLDMEALYRPFLEKVENGGYIVDAGCGSGRDVKGFVERGYQVLAFDASEELVALARHNTCLAVQQCTFFEFSTKPQSVHGIWACASLLHLPYGKLSEVLVHFSSFLISSGVIYCSFKYGDDQVVRNDRCFTNMNEARLKAVLEETDLVLVDVWLSEDLRPDRKDESWLNVILMKRSE